MSVYQTPPATFDDLVEPMPENVRRNARDLRLLITEALPDAEENIYGGKKMGNSLYSIGGPNNVVCGLQPTERTCKLFVHGWRNLQDLGLRLEGSGKNARHVKVDAVTDENRDLLTNLVLEARRACSL